MLIGSYLGSLGEKRRAAIPKKFLEELGNEPIIAKWYEDCLVIVSKDFWGRVLNRLTGGTGILQLGIRDIERFIVGSAFELEPDNQGRIIVPEILAQYAHFEKDLMFVGLGDRVEVWEKQIWDMKSDQLAKTTKEYIERLDKK